MSSAVNEIISHKYLSVCLAHGKQVRGRVVGNEVVARECGEDIVGPWKPQSGFGGVTESH